MATQAAGMVAGKSVIVTGGGSGIGRATVLLLLKEGANVMLGDVDEAGGDETVELAANAGGEVGFLRTDVTNGDEVDALVKRAVDRWGRLDGAVNNAGIDLEADAALQWQESTYDRMTQVNGKSIFTCMKRELAAMVPQSAGSIVNIGSIVSFAGAPGRPAYVACKHATIGLTRTAAIEFAKNGIRVNAVCPGGILTPLMEKDQDLKAAVAAANPMGRLGDAEEVAEAILWLISDRSSYVNGHSIVIDGGTTA